MRPNATPSKLSLESGIASTPETPVTPTSPHSDTAFLHSLRFRLLAMIIVVSSTTAIIAALFANTAITARFQSYLREDQARYAMQTRLFQGLVAQFLTLYYAPRGDWPPNIQQIVASMSEVIGHRIVLRGVGSSLWVDSSDHSVDELPSITSPYIGYEGDIVGVVKVQVPEPTADREGEQAFITSVSRALIIGVLLSASGACLLTLVITHPMLRTIESLTAAARQMAHKAQPSEVYPSSARGELGQLAHWFNQMSDALARAEQLRRNMVSDIAHELRTPLSNIRGYMEGLRDGVIAPEPELFDALHDQAMILNRLVIDLQQLALADAGQLRLVQQPARMQEIVMRAVNILQAEASQQGVTIRAEVPPDLPKAYVDVERVGQMLLNLLKNAIMYTPAGGHVSIRARVQGDKVAVIVRDTGQGIPPDMLAHVFERFYRVDPSRTRATGGSGLGLAIVKQLAQAHGGDVWVESTPGKGSTFTFTLPCAIV